jgi:hypothetical protein
VMFNYAATSILLGIVGAWLSGSGLLIGLAGTSATIVNVACLLPLVAGMLQYPSNRWTRLIVFCAGFGVVELIADALCVEVTKTLDYSVARSPMILSSPWWMPVSWALVACQVMLISGAAAERFGEKWRVLSGAGLAFLMLAFHEDAAFRADWWRYQDCFMVGKAPVYVLLAELLIGGMLAWIMGQLKLGIRKKRVAQLIGLAGVGTVIAGMIGFGTIEVLPVLFRGQPHPLVPFLFK